MIFNILHQLDLIQTTPNMVFQQTTSQMERQLYIITLQVLNYQIQVIKLVLGTGNHHLHLLNQILQITSQATTPMNLVTNLMQIHNQQDTNNLGQQCLSKFLWDACFCLVYATAFVQSTPTKRNQITKIMLMMNLYNTEQANLELRYKYE